MTCSAKDSSRDPLVKTNQRKTKRRRKRTRNRLTKSRRWKVKLKNLIIRSISMKSSLRQNYSLTTLSKILIYRRTLSSRKIIKMHLWCSWTKQENQWSSTTRWTLIRLKSISTCLVWVIKANEISEKGHPYNSLINWFWLLRTQTPPKIVPSRSTTWQILVTLRP